jgi:hypothetical protein
MAAIAANFSPMMCRAIRTANAAKFAQPHVDVAFDVSHGRIYRPLAGVSLRHEAGRQVNSGADANTYRFA